VIRPCIAAGLLTLLSAAAARADQVVLLNGDVLSGKIIEASPDFVRLEHPTLGHMVLPTEKVQSVTRDATPVTPAEKTVVQPPPAAVSVAPSPTAPTPVVVAPPPATAPATAPTTYPATTQALDPIVLRPIDKFLRFVRPMRAAGWVSHLELGFNGTSGDSDTLNLRFGFKTEKKTLEDRWRVLSTYNLDTANSENTRNEFIASFTKDWLEPAHKHFYYATAAYEYNQFNDWEQRVSGGAGIGYEWVKNPIIEFTTRTGIGAKREFGSDDDHVQPEASVGAEFNWRLSPRQKIAASATYYNELIELENNRVVSSLEWVFKVDQVDKVSLKLGVQDEYESSTTDDSKHNDAKFFGAIVFDF